MHCISSSSQEPVSLYYATTYRGATPVDHTTIPHEISVPSFNFTLVGVTSAMEKHRKKYLHQECTIMLILVHRHMKFECIWCPIYW